MFVAATLELYLEFKKDVGQDDNNSVVFVSDVTSDVSSSHIVILYWGSLYFYQQPFINVIMFIRIYTGK